MGHVGARVSALVDGQLPRAESERLWAHVLQCGLCRAQVEREGWVKTQLAGLALSCPEPAAPHALRGALSGVAAQWRPPGAPDGMPTTERRRVMAFAAIGAGSIGAAMVGVIAMSVPAEAPGVDRRGPATSLTQPSSDPTTTAVRGPGASTRLARVGAGLASGRIEP